MNTTIPQFIKSIKGIEPDVYMSEFFDENYILYNILKDFHGSIFVTNTTDKSISYNVNIDNSDILKLDGLIFPAYNENFIIKIDNLGLITIEKVNED